MDPSSIGHGAGGGETLQDPARERIQPMLTSRSRKVTTMSVPGSSQIQFPSVLSADFAVDQVTDPGGAPADVLDLDLGFAVNGHIDFPNWLGGTGNVSVYADQLGGGYNQKILSKDHHHHSEPDGSSGHHDHPLDVDLPHRPAIQLDTAFRSFASAGFDGVQPRRRLHLQWCALGHRSVRGNGELHDQLSLWIFFIASSSRKSLTQVRGSGMAAAASPGPAPEYRWRWSASGEAAGSAKALRLTI